MRMCATSSEHSKARTVIVSTRKQLTKVIAAREELPELEHIVVLDPLDRKPDGVLSWEELLARADECRLRVCPRNAGLKVKPDAPRNRDVHVRDDGHAKGHPVHATQPRVQAFRTSALALPEIGEDDVFLCFLPLFHTFGRFLEMLGCVFWGSTYCFLDNPSPRALTGRDATVQTDRYSSAFPRNGSNFTR